MGDWHFRLKSRGGALKGAHLLATCSVCGLYFSHPEAKYFAVGKIDRDQVDDYHRRKGMHLRAVERWLRPILNYDPDLQESAPKAPPFLSHPERRMPDAAPAK